MSKHNDNDGSTGPEITRRQLLRTTGAGAGALAVGAGAPGGPVPNPVGDADAFACGGVCVGTGVAALIVAAGAGIAIGAKISSDDLDPKNVIKKQAQSGAYDSATAAYGGRSTIRDAIRSNHVDNAAGTSTFGDSAWSEAETAAALEYEESGNVASAKNAAAAALDKT